MKQFNLSEWLTNKSRKVTTRLGNREVRIICWDRKNKDNRPIITLMIDPDGNEYTTFHTENGFVDNKEKYIDKRDLFFVDEEEELTEFEKAVQSICKNLRDGIDDIGDIHVLSNNLLDLARKELEATGWRDSMRKYKETYEQGKQDVLKDLESLIEDKVAEKFAELLKDLQTLSPIQPNPYPNPFQPTTVLYGCPSIQSDVIYCDTKTQQDNE